MEYIQLTQENLQKEHICCSMTEKKGDHSVTDKKTWLKERMEEGLVFYSGRQLDAHQLSVGFRKL